MFDGILHRVIKDLYLYSNFDVFLVFSAYFTLQVNVIEMSSCLKIMESLKYYNKEYRDGFPRWQCTTSPHPSGLIVTEPKG